MEVPEIWERVFGQLNWEDAKRANLICHSWHAALTPRLVVELVALGKVSLKVLHRDNPKIYQLLCEGVRRDFPRQCPYRQFVQLALDFGEPRLFFRLVKISPEITTHNWWVVNVNLVSEFGNPQVLDWIRRTPHCGHTQTKEQLRTAAENYAFYGHLRALKILRKWLREELDSDFRFSRQWRRCKNLMDLAAGAGRLNVLKWLHRTLSEEESAEECTADAMDRAAENGHLNVLRWLHVHRREGCNEAIYKAAAAGRREVVKWLAETRHEVATTAAMDAAAWNGHLDVVKYLHRRRTVGATARAINNAAANGHLDVVKWMCQKEYGYTYRAMELAAEYGHLDVLIWLHSDGGWCTEEAMNRAAQNGHLEVVKWLHANRTEGCTKEAMDWAACDGRLEMVKWLNANRTEGCSERAMTLAALNGHLEVVKWLHSNRMEGCEPTTMTSAVNGRRGLDSENVATHLEVIQWLCENRKECCVVPAYQAAQRAERDELIEYLEAQLSEDCPRCNRSHRENFSLH
jgi:hypothetical protein